MQKNVDIAKNLQDYQVSKYLELKRANENKEEAKMRRKVQDEETLKYRMFQVVKWELIRKKEKEMLARLNFLRDKRDRSLTFIAHIVLYCTLVRLNNKFTRLRDKRKRELKVLMGSLLL